MNLYHFIVEHLRESSQTINSIPSTSIVRVATEVAYALGVGNKLMLCGNGGSAADAQHIAAEFVNKLDRHRGALPAIALTTDSSILTACANDYGFEHVFERQVKAIGCKGDVLIAISTSGKSENAILAVEACKQMGILTISLTGQKPSYLSKSADISILVPSNNTQHIQEAHIVIGHILCKLVEEQLWGTLQTN